MTREELEILVAKGESETLEFKKTTGQLNRAGETLCAFLNARGGQLFFGVTPGGRILGQQVVDKTLQDLGEMLRAFEPSVHIQIERLPVEGKDMEILSLSVSPHPESQPYTFRGRAYMRVGSSTTLMPQERYQQLLLQRVHGRFRWENQRALSYSTRDLDSDEIIRTLRLGVDAGRIPETAEVQVEAILRRLGLISDDGFLLNAAVVLFGKSFLPDSRNDIQLDR